jgi:signal transduction histidine kinase
MLILAVSPYREHPAARVGIFLFDLCAVTAGLWELGQRGVHARSRATQRRVRFLVVTGALAGLFSLIDFVWVIGWDPAYYPPPVGVVLSVVFLFMLAQALRHERLLDLSEMLGRLLVATAVAFLIAFVFYLLVTVIGQFNTMWLNAILVAIVVLVLLNPLREWVEGQMQRYVFRESGRLAATLGDARRRLAHTLELEDLGNVVMTALDRSRSVTTAALYVVVDDGTVYEQAASLGKGAPPRIEAAAAHALLERLKHGVLVVEQLAHDAREGRPPPEGHPSHDAVLAACEVLGAVREHAVVAGADSEEGELLGLLVVADERVGDAFGPEDLSALESLASQIGVVVENSRVYARMKERDRLAVLGQMAAGLAHEIRNPLGAIKGAAQLLREPPAAPDESQQEFVGIILEEVERLNAVVGSVLDLARQNDDRVAPIDVNGVVRRTLQVMSADWAGLVEVETDLEEELARAAIGPAELRQVLINLLRNAVQAMKGKGRIVVRTRTRSRTEGARGLGPRSGDHWVVIHVRDEGPGIAPSALKNLFLPFFTTKEDGTGLGLAICQRIVQSAGGRIDVRSRVGEGTTVDVVLPAAMEALGTPVPPAPVPAAEAGADGAAAIDPPQHGP